MFNTTTALLRHRESKHRIAALKAEWATFVKLYNGQQIVQPPARIRTRSINYKQWISGIVESLNSSLHPKAAGKWCRVERYYVPETYIQALLARMPNAFLNSAREKRHLRPPVWREKSKVFHYRDHEVNDVISALSQSSVPLQLKKSYRGDTEVNASNELLNAHQALQAAKERARGKKSSTIPTQHIEIVVGNGEGRATREFEVIWWPDLFSGTRHGKLTLRFYVSKVIL
ncbi:hypothetical protein AWC38_SpisGene21173 [Stylophora pistillata]|uniref:Uncharacterized protein n=1 Tax=Stylophora pistillata TaxID=50429 RepID=A0A2B4RCY8_STYPI|nr:hypothetical protein AWC38_SpisGene21173 [Stylophora pistillata]